MVFPKNGIDGGNTEEEFMYPSTVGGRVFMLTIEEMDGKQTGTVLYISTVGWHAACGISL